MHPDPALRLAFIAAALSGCTGATVDLNAVAPDCELVVTPHRTPTRIQLINQGPGAVVLTFDGEDAKSGWTDTLGTGAMDLGIGVGKSLVIRAADPDWPESPLIRIVVDTDEGCTITRRPIPAR